MDHKTARFWSKSEQTRQTGRIVPPPYHDYGKHPKRQIPPLVYEHDTALFVIAAVLFRRSGFFSGGEVAKRGAKPAIGDGISWATPCKRSRSLKRSLETAAARVMSLGGSVVAKVSDYTHRRVSAIPPSLLLTAAHSRSFFRRSRLFILFHPTGYYKIKN